jgi:hypothetical protein
MWVCDCFDEFFVALVKEIGMDETGHEIALAKQKWVSVSIGDSTKRDLDLGLEFKIPVHYQQRVFNTCLFWWLALAFHHLGREQTGLVLALIAKKYENLPGYDRVQAIIMAVTKHKILYKKMDYWKKEKVKDVWVKQPNAQSCWYCADVMAALHMPWWSWILLFLMATAKKC